MFVCCFYYVLVLGNRRLGSLILSTLLMNWFTEMSFIYQYMINCYVSACFFFQNADKILGKSALLSNGKGSNADKVQDSDTSLLVSNKVDKTAKEDYLEDSETTPKSCLGLVFELLATAACTSYSNSLAESVRFLESQLQAKRHRSAVLRQEAEGLRKSLEHSDAYFCWGTQ